MQCFVCVSVCFQLSDKSTYQIHYVGLLLFLASFYGNEYFNYLLEYCIISNLLLTEFQIKQIWKLIVINHSYTQNTDMQSWHNCKNDQAVLRLTVFVLIDQRISNVYLYKRNCPPVYITCNAFFCKKIAARIDSLLFKIITRNNSLPYRNCFVINIMSYNINMKIDRQT